MGLPIVGAAVKVVSSGIGLASEAIENHKQKKAAKARSQLQGQGSDVPERSAAGTARQESGDPPPTYSVSSPEHSPKVISNGDPDPATEEDPSSAKAKAHRDDDDDDSDEDVSDHDDEVEWALDDAAEAADPPSYEDATGKLSNDQLIDQVLKLAGPSPLERHHIPAPVIIPQRRPRDRARGFVRAYPPVLGAAGISQECFLTFTKNFYHASQSSPWLKVVMLGATAAGFVPEVAAQVTSAVVSVAVGTAQELQRRHRTNTYLDRMNQQLFVPRGLFAMVVTYKPEASKPVDAQQLDISSSIAKYTRHDAGAIKEVMKDLRVSSGTAYGQLELPKAAPLLYPAIDDAAFGNDEKKQNILKGTGKVMADYLDRRAQARYIKQNPGSVIEYEQPQFASRFSDPNHAVNTGSWIALVTGGAYDPRARRQAKRDSRNARRVARGKAPRPSRLPKEQREPKTFVRRALRKNILYLLIVDLPSEEEIAKARDKLARFHSQGASSSR